ncbi:MAG TPA: hypothetical protein PKY59_07405 [Pyrinomonadaceae bacterium]|nr:hypothetical protein [Pyrinomonadaceae bacterium]
MKKILFCAILFLFALSANSFVQTSQKYRKISEMIADSQKTNGLFPDMFGADFSDANSAETTMLSTITFPNEVKVKSLGETRKLSKTRKKSTDKWLKKYGEMASEQKFYTNEIAVEEDGKRFWIIAHEKNVIEKLKNSSKNGDEIILKMRILGFYKKGQTTDYFLMAESVK